MNNEIIIFIGSFVKSGVFPLFLIGMWIAVSFSLSRSSGWSKLKDKFQPMKSSSNDGGQSIDFHIGGGKLGGVYHRGSLCVGATPDNLILKTWWLFRLGHPPLQIPWSAIASLSISEPKLSQDNIMNLNLGEKINKKNFYAQYAEVVLHEFPEVYIEIPWHEKLNKYLPLSLRSAA